MPKTKTEAPAIQEPATQKSATQEAAAQEAATQEPEYPPIHLDVRIHRINPNGHERAVASVKMNGCFSIRNVKVIDGRNGMYAAMPSYYSKPAEKYKEQCFPVTKEFYDQFQSAVLDAYHQALTASHESALANGSEPERDMGSMKM